MLDRIYKGLVLLVISLYLLFEYGFMQLRIPPVEAAGIPVGELVLLFSLLIISYFKLLPQLSATVFLVPFAIWWVLGIGRALLGVPEYGLWALRDATHVIESLFLIVGFVFASRIRDVERFFRWLPWFLLVVCIYALGYPLREGLQSLSPKVIGGAGHEVPLFFNYANTGQLLLLAAAYLMLFRGGRLSLGAQVSTIIAALLVGYATIMFQMRSIYLQILAILVLFAVYRRETVGKATITTAITLFALLGVISMAEMQVEGRLAQQASVEFLVSHFLTLTGGGTPAGGGSPVVQDAASGVSLRLGWWTTLYDNWVADAGTFLFGMGYGFPLVDFIYAVDNSEGVAVREPHNSYISIVARIGLVGALAFVWMHALLLRVWYRTYRTYTSMRWREGQNRLLIFMVFFIMVWVYALGEDAFEKPFFAIPYYFFWGIVLQMSRHLTMTTDKLDIPTTAAGYDGDGQAGRKQGQERSYPQPWQR